MLCGVIKSTENDFEMKGLCLQTSNLKGDPHQIDVSINFSESKEEPKKVDVKIKACCSCKAGSPKCKHIIAVLLCIYK